MIMYCHLYFHPNRLRHFKTVDRELFFFLLNSMLPSENALPRKRIAIERFSRSYRKVLHKSERGRHLSWPQKPPVFCTQISDFPWSYSVSLWRDRPTNRTTESWLTRKWIVNTHSVFVVVNPIARDRMESCSFEWNRFSFFFAPNRQQLRSNFTSFFALHIQFAVVESVFRHYFYNSICAKSCQAKPHTTTNVKFNRF